MLLGAIADDLTGATDLALTLSRTGMRVLQVVGVPETRDFGPAEAVVVSLKSRTIPAAAAVTQSTAAARALLAGGAQQILFKYCSTFDSTDDGNIGAVIDALLDLLCETRTIACPAFPANGRRVYRGHLFVGDALLSESPMRDHPLTPMRDANLPRVLQRQTSRAVSLIPHEVVTDLPALEDAITRLTGIAIVDAVNDTDLCAIGRAARGLRLVTGGSGIALGLPANLLPEGRAAEPVALTVAPGRGVILAGSCSAATQGQVASAIAAGLPALRLDALEIAEGRMTCAQAADFVNAATGDMPPLVYSSADSVAVRAVQDRLGRDQAGTLIEDFLAQLARILADSGTNRFIVAGGETSGAVVNGLGLSALEIGPEIAPGVPWTRTPDARFGLALKSGNFGTPEFFLRAWQMRP